MRSTACTSSRPQRNNSYLFDLIDIKVQNANGYLRQLAPPSTAITAPLTYLAQVETMTAIATATYSVVGVGSNGICQINSSANYAP
jgi:hypothetical protein